MKNYIKLFKEKLSSFLTMFFNPLNEYEIKIIKSTQLFNDFSDHAFNKMIKYTKRLKYPAETLLVKEGEVGNDFFVILEGSVRVFTLQQGEKIALARLEKGSYFGEQAIISQTNNSRNASVEAITNVILAQINKTFVIPHWQKNQRAMKKIQKIGQKQIFKILSETIIHYKNVLADLQKIKNAFIKEFVNGKVIFSYGEKPDNVYLILEGAVELLFPETGTKKIAGLIIQRGQFFGETGVLTKQPRSATAIAQQNVKLLCISGKNFRKTYRQWPELQRLLQKQKRIYSLPIQGVVQEFIGRLHGLRMFTHLYTLEDGRKIIANTAIEGHLFSMREYNKEITQRCYHENDIAQVEIGLNQNTIAEVQAYGEWDSLPAVCKMILNQEKLTAQQINQFEISGILLGKEQSTLHNEARIICDCMLVRQDKIQQAIDQGAKNLNTISNITGACTVCRKCKFRIMEMLGKSIWLSASLVLAQIHNDLVRSYYIKPATESVKKIVPGQYVIIQVKVNGNWLERPYTISDILPDGSLRITVKREQKGLFSNWLFDQGSDLIKINMTQPQGEFTLNEEDEIPALCFAGGIGITPFAVQIKHLHTQKRIHILYCALKQSDFVFLDEFNEITRALPSVTVDFRSNEQAGMLSEPEIINLVQKFSNEEIYICGPEGFEKFISSTLDHIHFDKNKIHVEKFTHAGAPSL